MNRSEERKDESNRLHPLEVLDILIKANIVFSDDNEGSSINTYIDMVEEFMDFDGNFPSRYNETDWLYFEWQAK